MRPVLLILLLILAIHAKAVERVGVACGICSTVIDTIRKQIPSGGLDVMKELVNMCEKFSNVFSPEFGDDCKKYVEKNMNIIMPWILNQMSSEKICNAIKSC
ncbi:unnamed protein product [Caenorhabditis angaria]|uniref:Saposin B-type domain-containing protein n=1 Tax=Caenorhabditis angaria TaxID=860376 RepID=A0A9P1IE47_9PELO|nr:unnamed protein product [Caenorhabditis angaria]